MLFHIRLIIVMFFIVFLFLGFFCTLLSCYIYPPPVQTNPQRFLHPPQQPHHLHKHPFYPRALTVILLSYIPFLSFPLFPQPQFTTLWSCAITLQPLLPDPPPYCPAQSPLLHPSDSKSRSLPPSPYPLRFPIQSSPTVSPPTEILNPSLPYHLPTHPDTISHPPHHRLPIPRFKISSSPTVSSPTQRSNLTLPYHLLTNPVFVSRAPC